ncbi:dTDP-4-dehydrorhamnose reductase [uncultured Pseudomonas sp.]|uniref:dTDP-4-dehydrorhamnose reductase n=1 Tax=uncultured Pseudomonas sp. TaxID=114707 RepID=UPI0030D7B64A|tara:strand:- start:549 stop:1442 length:894 start_codon:yes stop_codon:yes gene_type:complete
MRILLLGKYGQVGWELQRSLATLGEVIALDRAGSGGLTGDLADLKGLRASIRRCQPDVIVNAAAYTAVDQAEQQELATLINAGAPAVMAEEALSLGALLVHYSTDYVFNGEGAAFWTETDHPAPINQYGAGKLAGEQAIQASGCRHLIFRTSWVYASRAKNFLITMQRFIRERDALTIVADQIGAPTSAELIADVTELAIRRTIQNPELQGLYHLAASGETSWHGYAVTIAEWLELQGYAIRAVPGAIKPIPTAEYPTPARRPLNSRLDTRKLRDAFDVNLPPWQVGVTRALAELTL